MLPGASTEARAALDHQEVGKKGLVHSRVLMQAPPTTTAAGSWVPGTGAETGRGAWSSQFLKEGCGAVGVGLWLDALSPLQQKPTACQLGRPVQVPQSSFFSLLKSSANLRSCSLAAWDSSCRRWLFCLRLATSDCSTTLSCFSWEGKRAGSGTVAKALLVVHRATAATGA